MAKKETFQPGQWNGIGLDPLAARPDPIANPMGNHTFLDNLVHGLFGHPTSEMNKEDAAATAKSRKAKQNEAYALSKSAAKNPGAEFMGAPDLGGGGGIGGLIKTVAGLFAGGGKL